ncbi:MAG: hypothetical protein WHX53_16260, partial [Anaerolineae bacterium]
MTRCSEDTHAAAPATADENVRSVGGQRSAVVISRAVHGRRDTHGRGLRGGMVRLFSGRLTL